MTARKKGFGLELRELRDYQSGDAFKNIAWRATARRGKVISREFESDLSVSAWIALDVSPSMFWGREGHARIDFAMETTYSLASMMNAIGQHCGLTLFDTEVRHVVAPGAGKAQLRRVSNALLEVSSLVHENRTEIGNMELVQAVARWFWAQEGIDFHLSNAYHSDASSLDLARLASAARKKMYAFLDSEHEGRPVIPITDYAQEPNQALFRAFARYAGLGLPLEPEPIPDGQSYGLAATLEDILSRGGGPHTVIVISDLHTVDDVDVVRRAALAMRNRKHKVVIFCPSDPSFDKGDSPESVLHAALGHTASIATRQRLLQARMALQPTGISFLHCGPQDVLGRLLDRLRRAA